MEEVEEVVVVRAVRVEVATTKKRGWASRQKERRGNGVACGVADGSPRSPDQEKGNEQADLHIDG